MFFRFWAAAALGALLACAPAWAEPVTVQLRVEGASSTIFEGPVTTDGKQIDKGGGPHPCDGTNGGANPSPVPTATSALDDGSLAGGFTWDGAWTPSLQDFLINRIGPDASDSTRFWGIGLNFTSLSVGGCQQRVRTGDEVLFGYDFFSKAHLLKLTGPATAPLGQPVTLNVTDGQDGSAIAGATIAGAAGAVTGPDGSATISFDSAGLKVLKAERPDSLRSNALVVCVPEPNRSDCGPLATAPVAGGVTLPAGVPAPAVGGAGRPARDSRAPTAGISAPRHARRYRRGPRLLRGRASDSESGVGEVKLALRRHVHGRSCRWWSGRRERFVGSSCRKAFFFAVGDDPDWSYLLPRRLPPGHYVLDVKAFDRAGNRDERFERGAGRAVFEVLDRSGHPVGPPALRGSTASARHASAAGRGARVEVMVVGRTRILAAPRTVRARPRRVRASGRRCLVGQSNPLSALAEALRLARISYHLRDFGRCSSRNAASSGQLFVDRIGSDRNRGDDGWFYKVNDRAGTTGAADPSGIRGGKLRAGDRVLWFYCVFETAARSCQQSLELVPSKRVARVGESLPVRVLGYRNEGRSAPVAGATVTAGASSRITDAAGFAAVSLDSSGRHELRAVKDGALPSFPVTVRVR